MMEQTPISRRLASNEASMLSQRLVPNKSAVNWLEHDRRSDPVVRFSYRSCEVAYGSSNLEYYVQRGIQ